jgi:hypothetical protein
MERENARQNLQEDTNSVPTSAVASTNRESFHIIHKPKHMYESMDFEETESVMWRKVLVYFKLMKLSLTISAFFCFLIASIEKIFPGSRPVVDELSSHDCLEVDPCCSIGSLDWYYRIYCSLFDWNINPVQVWHHN